MWQASFLKCEREECNEQDCPCVQFSRWREREWVERYAKAVRNVGDLWAFTQGLKEIARREVARLEHRDE